MGAPPAGEGPAGDHLPARCCCHTFTAACPVDCLEMVLSTVTFHTLARAERAPFDPPATDGWGFADLLPYFRLSERTDGRDPALRGTHGPVRVGPVPEGKRHPVAETFARLRRRSAGYCRPPASGW
jgi:choline dehydrogenase